MCGPDDAEPNTELAKEITAKVISLRARGKTLTNTRIRIYRIRKIVITM